MSNPIVSVVFGLAFLSSAHAQNTGDEDRFSKFRQFDGGEDKIAHWVRTASEMVAGVATSWASIYSFIDKNDRNAISTFSQYKQANVNGAIPVDLNESRFSFLWDNYLAKEKAAIKLAQAKVNAASSKLSAAKQALESSNELPNRIFNSNSGSEKLISDNRAFLDAVSGEFETASKELVKLQRNFSKSRLSFFVGNEKSEFFNSELYNSAGGDAARKYVRRYLSKSTSNAAVNIAGMTVGAYLLVDASLKLAVLADDRTPGLCPLAVSLGLASDKGFEKFKKFDGNDAMEKALTFDGRDNASGWIGTSLEFTGATVLTWGTIHSFISSNNISSIALLRQYKKIDKVGSIPINLNTSEFEYIWNNFLTDEKLKIATAEAELKTAEKRFDAESDALIKSNKLPLEAGNTTGSFSPELVVQNREALNKAAENYNKAAHAVTQAELEYTQAKLAFLIKDKAAFEGASEVLYNSTGGIAARAELKRQVRVATKSLRLNVVGAVIGSYFLVDSLYKIAILMDDRMPGLAPLIFNTAEAPKPVEANPGE